MMNMTNEQWARILQPTHHAVFAAVVFCCGVAASPAAPVPPERPRVFLETSLASTPVTGKTIVVPAAGDFQAA